MGEAGRGKAEGLSLRMVAQTQILPILYEIHRGRQQSALTL
jgi:hypothetical protein